MGGGKKRKSVSKSEQNSSSSIKQPLSGDESDYGVLSDPDENASIPIMSNASEQSPSPAPAPATAPATATATATVTASAPAPAPAPAPAESVTIDNVIECDNVIIQTSSSKETVDPVILQTLQKEEEDDTHYAGVGQPQLYDKSLEILKIKLEKSIETNKLSHTTFLWFIVTVMEIDNEVTEALTKVSNPESYDTKNPERLIEYIIKTHSLNNEVEQYTLTMLQLGVVSHIMKGLIEFNMQLNKNEKRQGIIYPYMKSLERLNPDDKAPAPSPASNDSIKKPNKFIALCKNIIRCCKCCRRSRKDSILTTELESPENYDEVNTNATPVSNVTTPTPTPTPTPTTSRPSDIVTPNDSE
jgi:hypothetical protein